MIRYLTNEDYLNIYGGGEHFSSDEEFNRLETAARRLIDAQTFGRVSKMSVVPDEVKYLTAELINRLKADSDNEDERRLQSETLDKWTRSYAVESDDDRRKRYASLICDRLAGVVGEDGVPLLYMGVDAL